MIFRFVVDDLLSISLSSVMGTEKAGDGGLKHLPPRRFSLKEKTGEVDFFAQIITWVSIQPVAGAEAGPSLAEACKSGVASFLTW